MHVRNCEKYYQNVLFQDLNVTQVYRIGTMFWDDKYGTHGLSPDVRTCQLLLVNSSKYVNFMSL